MKILRGWLSIPIAAIGGFLLVLGVWLLSLSLAIYDSPHIRELLVGVVNGLQERGPTSDTRIH